MIIKCKIIKFRGDVGESSNGEKEVNSSWYTAQNYFNEHLKDEFLSSDYDTIHLHWRGKRYEFKRKKNDDKRHKEGRKKRASRNSKTA